MTSVSPNRMVSVIIPIYNGQRYIETTVRSVLAQTYGDYEILCLIDGTRDESAAIIDRLNNGKIQQFHHANRGATYTRNRGLQLARGEYILFLDQDDVLEPEFLEAAIQELERTGATGVAVNGQLIDGEGRVIRRMYRINKPVLTYESLLKGNQLCTASQVLLKRKPLVEKIGAFDLNADQADDWDMWIRQAQYGKLVFLDRYLMNYRMHDSNQSLNYGKMLRSELHIVEGKLNGLRNHHAIKSYSYMRYSSRAADWKALSKALRLNASLVLQPRFYWTVCQVAWTRMWRHG